MWQGRAFRLLFSVALTALACDRGAAPPAGDEKIATLFEVVRLPPDLRLDWLREGS